MLLSILVQHKMRGTPRTTPSTCGGEASSPENEKNPPAYPSEGFFQIASCRTLQGQAPVAGTTATIPKAPGTFDLLSDAGRAVRVLGAHTVPRAPEELVQPPRSGAGVTGRRVEPGLSTDHSTRRQVRTVADLDAVDIGTAGCPASLFGLLSGDTGSLVAVVGVDPLLLPVADDPSVDGVVAVLSERVGVGFGPVMEWSTVEPRIDVPMEDIVAVGGPVLGGQRNRSVGGGASLSGSGGGDDHHAHG